MLSSKEGFSFQGIDMDSISDITGISFSGINHEEYGSPHSGSVGSDNTELLLHQNISLRELDDDDSFMDSVSQVGDFEEHTGHHQNFSSSPKQYHSSNTKAVAGSNNSMQGGIKELTVGQSTSFMEQEFSPKNNSNKLSPPNYLTRKYPSDTQIESCGRRSVIKHHSHISSVKPEVTPVSYYGENVQDLHSSDLMGKQRFVNGQDHSRAKQIHFHPHSAKKDILHDGTTGKNKKGNVAGSSKIHAGEQNGLQTKPSREHLTNGSRRHVNSHEKIPMFDRTDGGNFNRHERQLNSDYQERYPSQQKMGPVGSEQQDLYHGGPNLQGYNVASNEVQEMLLGVKHDPETNELYDDKVREGANLLSIIFGGDHNGSFNSLSSTSRGSEKSLDQDKTKSRSHHENRPQPTTQRPMDTSLNNDAKYESASPLTKYTKQLSQSSSKFYVNRSDRKPAATSSRAVGESSTLHGSAKEHLWNQDQIELNNVLPSRSKAMVLKRDDETQECANVSEFIKNDYNDGCEDNIQRSNDPVLRKYRSPNKNTEVTDDEEIVQDRIEELQRLEMDIEEIHSRKKMAMDELNILEESLNRNKADMKSSEDLVEQYRWQATQTRSELMELEKTRNQLQEECNALNEILEKSKQKKTSNEMMFGRSKEDIFTSLQERDKFKKELELANETLGREKERAKVAHDDLREKIGVLEDDLKKQHEETVENLKMMKEQLNKERQKVRTVQHEKLNAVNKLHDEMKELQEKEIEALRAQMLRERSANVELLEDKFKREANHLKKSAENAESRLTQLEEYLAERNDEISKLRQQHQDEKQKTLDIEKQWRAQLESERQDAEIRLDEQERTGKDQENKHLHQQTELENLVEQRTAELRRSEERCKSQTEELQRIIENKNEEIKLVRSLVRQQEDATRVLGERLRTEAREHVRNAVEKERHSLNKEKERIGRSLEEEKEKNATTVRQFTEQLEMEKHSHLQTKQTITKLKQEAEELRRKVLEVHGERITGVQRARLEGGEELEKIKEKLHEFTLQAEKLERIDNETAKAIYEECRKIAELVDMPMSFKTRLTDDKSDEKVNGVRESPTKEALAGLRHCNNELRQRLSDIKKQMDKQREQIDNMKQTSVPSGPDEELSNLQKLLEEKEEEIERLHKKYGDEILNLQAEKKKEQFTYKRTVVKLEQEFQKLITANINVPGSVRMGKSDIVARNGNSSSSAGGPKVLHNASPAQFVARSVQKTSSTDLLKHLQDRVKKLRAENENLKNSSAKETSFESVKPPRKVKWLADSDSALLQSKRLTISQLGSPVKSLEMKSQQNFDLMNGNVEQMARLKKLLASTTKDNSTLTNTG